MLKDNKKPEGLVSKIAYATIPFITLAAGFFGGYVNGKGEGFSEAQEIYRPVTKAQERVIQIQGDGMDLLTRVSKEINNMYSLGKEYLQNQENKKRLDELYLELRTIKERMLEEQKRILELKEKLKEE